ncbi:MAG: hypothetical protein ACYS9Y_00815 [Planctomycetota bacterium]|jgi:hypothetical protein
MATEAQILANRRNAQKSTGPRTTQGRAAVSKNAVKHGLLAQQDVISSENRAEFDLHRAQILEELSPKSPMESVLTDRIVSLSWRLRRAVRFQNQAIDALNAPKKPSLYRLKKAKLLKRHGLSPTEPSESSSALALGRLAVKDFKNARVLDRLLMYERRIEHSLYKTLLELQRLNLVKKLNPESKTPFNK